MNLELLALCVYGIMAVPAAAMVYPICNAAAHRPNGVDEALFLGAFMVSILALMCGSLLFLLFWELAQLHVPVALGIMGVDALFLASGYLLMLWRQRRREAVR